MQDHEVNKPNLEHDYTLEEAEEGSWLVWSPHFSSVLALNAPCAALTR